MSAAMRLSGLNVILARVALFFLLCLSLPAWANGQAEAASPLVLPPAGELQVFVRQGCPHCGDAKTFLDELARSRPELRIIFREVDRDDGARDALVAISRAVGAWPPGVPTFVYGMHVLVGFDDAAHTGAELQRLIDNAPPPARDRVDSALFGTLSASELGLPLFTLALGLLDGFNPCAMWVLLFLLSLLVRLNDRRRMGMVAGTFVVTSGVVYYAFMAAWLNVFLFVGMSEALRIGLAALAILIGSINTKDFFAFRHGVSLSIPESAKPGIYARARGILSTESLPASLAAVAGLAVMVNFVELLCTRRPAGDLHRGADQPGPLCACPLRLSRPLHPRLHCRRRADGRHRGTGAGQRQARRAWGACAEAGLRTGDARARRGDAAAAGVVDVAVRFRQGRWRGAVLRKGPSQERRDRGPTSSRPPCSS